MGFRLPEDSGLSIAKADQSHVQRPAQGNAPSERSGTWRRPSWSLPSPL
jgi:hypothetical protein